MKRLSFLILIFATVFVVFFIAPALLNIRFDPYPLMKNGDVLDILTPLVSIPLYWLMYRLNDSKAISLRGGLSFLYVFCAILGSGARHAPFR